MSVRKSFIDAQTVWPIVQKLGKALDGHLAGKIGKVSCTCFYGGLHERQIKGGEVSSGNRKIERN